MTSNFFDRVDMPNRFVYQRDVTPFCSHSTVLFAILGYLLSILLLQALMRGRPPISLGFLSKIHNLNLCIGSLIMFMGAAYEAYKEYNHTGSAQFLVCLPMGFQPKGGVYFWSYVYYLSKFYEFLDTAILVLRGKGLNFLHVFHHAFVILMAYLWLDAAQSLQTLGLLANTAIHVVMYLYYFLVSCGYKPAWKQLVTKSQIVQFLISFISLIPFMSYHMSNLEGCSGVGALLFNAMFNFALIMLFGNFFKNAYSANGSAKNANNKSD
eukprot:CAMPEP_0196571222 /NCGR_PEP_ID=MMETSP1081-20130531/1400_1 /TAXON_ID=36882 /ORGANISM="Pyramimonas amylifera, Strain CCMP720" /LENGTH=266 /DNA_ID=CAMNT_0041888067 /DNA_START=95 /DNA_END=895 /DNA_ORIENTATION=+